VEPVTPNKWSYGRNQQITYKSCAFEAELDMASGSSTQVVVILKWTRIFDRVRI